MSTSSSPAGAWIESGTVGFCTAPILAGALLLTLLAEAQFQVNFAFDVTLIPRNIHAPEVARTHLTRLGVARMLRRSVTAGGRRQNLCGIAAQSCNFCRKPIEPANKDCLPPVAGWDGFLNVAQD